jgi:hypothetical protein
MNPCNKKICEKSNYNFASNNMSTKMLQAQALKLKTNAKIVYKNSRIQSIYRTILSLNYYDNKDLLIKYKYKLYKRYFDDIQNVSQSVKDGMQLMLTNIITNLKKNPFEYNLVFEINIVEPVVEVETYIDSKLIFYVMTRVLSNVSYFIIKNITQIFVFEPGYSYVFDLSDPSNIGTKFGLSDKMDGISHKGNVYSGVPGNPGATLTIYIEKLINTYSLYVFNDEERIKDVLSENYLSIKVEAYKNWGYTTSYIYVNVGNKKDVIIEENLYKNLLRESVLAVHEVNGPKYLMVDPADKRVQFYRNQYKYKVSYGTYYLYVPKMYPAALLNNGYEDCISFVGLPETKTVEMVRGLKLAPGNIQDMSQNFYYGEVALTVYKPFNQSKKKFEGAFSFYCAYYGFMDGFSFINFSESGDSYGSKYPVFIKNTVSKTENFILNGLSDTKTRTISVNGITCQSNLNFVIDGLNTYLSFNNDFGYDPYRRYGLYNGVYTIFNIPEKYPITLINNGKNTLVSLSSLKADCTTSGLGPDNNVYTFYWGTVSITVYGDFGQMSLYSTYQGYMGSSGLFIYDTIYDNSPSYPDPLSVPTITPNTLSNKTFTESLVNKDSYVYIELKQVLNTIISFSLFSKIIDIDNSYNTINLSNTIITGQINSNTSTTYNKYTLKHGMYIIRCSNSFMAILNNKKTDSIIYEGLVSKIETGKDGNKYTYFESQILVSVLSDFGYVTLDVLGTTFNGNNILSYTI